MIKAIHLSLWSLILSTLDVRLALAARGCYGGDSQCEDLHNGVFMLIAATIATAIFVNKGSRRYFLAHVPGGHWTVIVVIAGLFAMGGYWAYFGRTYLVQALMGQ